MYGLLKYNNTLTQLYKFDFIQLNKFRQNN